MKKIETERLILREMTPENFDRLYAVLADSGITSIPSAMLKATPHNCVCESQPPFCPTPAVPKMGNIAQPLPAQAGLRMRNISHFRNSELGQKFWLRLLAELCGVALTCSGHCLYQQIPLLQLTFYGRKECPGCRGRSGRRRCSRPGFRKPYGSGRRWTRLPLRLRGTRR